MMTLYHIRMYPQTRDVSSPHPRGMRVRSRTHTAQLAFIMQSVQQAIDT